MKKLIYILPLVALVACGEKETKEKVEKIEFSTSIEKTSYAVGVENALNIFKGGAQYENLDKDMVVKGFEMNLSDEEPKDCNATLMTFLGPNGQDFDTTYLKEGSECVGRVTAAFLYGSLVQMKVENEFDFDMLKRGFEDGLNHNDTISMSEEDRVAVLTDFNQTIQERMQAEKVALDQSCRDAAPAFWEAAKSQSNIREINGTGVYVQTVEEGTGSKIPSGSDFEMNYRLTNAVGDTIDSSYKRGQALRMNLNSVVEGWKIGVPEMKKGGKYYLYIPEEKGYGSMPGGPQGPLKFYMEVLDFGEAGTLVQPRPQYQGGY